MSIRVGSNPFSLQAQRRIGEATGSLARTFERLSSGQRINRASDDAAGLAIASSLDARARIYYQGVRNIEDGLSVTNIAQSALQQLQTIVLRQSELAEQSSNGVYSETQRQALQREGNQLTDEFNRILSTTSFNGLSLLSAPTSLSIQAGIGGGGAVSFVLGNEIAHPSEPEGSFSISSGCPASTTIDFSGAVSGQKSQIILLAPAGQGGFDSGQYFRIFDAQNTAYDVWFNIDSAGGYSGGLAVENRIQIDVAANESASSLAELAAQRIATQAGDNFAVNTLDAGGGCIQIRNREVGLVNPIDTNIAWANVGTVSWEMSTSINTNDYFSFEVAHEDGSSQKYVYSFNGTAPSFDPSLPGYTTISGNISEYTPPEMLAETVEFYISQAVGAGAIVSRQGASVTIANTVKGPVESMLVSGMPGTLLALTNGADSQVSESSNEFSVASHGLQTGQRVRLSSIGTVPGGLAEDADYYAVRTGASTFKLAASFSDAVSGAAVDITSSGSGRTSLCYFAMGQPARVTTLEYLDLETQTGARESLDALGIQLQRIADELGAIGAVEARLATAVGNLSVMAENFRAAESRIVDADMGEETASLVRNQIVQQSAAAVLAQANEQPRVALDLLQG